MLTEKKDDKFMGDSNQVISSGNQEIAPSEDRTDSPVRQQYARTFIKFNHEEVEALLNMLNEIEANSPLSETEKTAKDKLKRIYARQILSHEKWENHE